MHEVSLVEALIEQVGQEVGRLERPGRVLRIELVVGRLSCANPDSLRFAFELLAPGTVAEGAQLDISEPKAVCRCGACGVQTPIEELTANCPACGSSQVHIEGGRDLVLQSIELEDAA